MPKSVSDSLELRLERVNNRATLRMENLKRFYDRRPIIERYADGETELHVHLCSRLIGGLCLEYRKHDRSDFAPMGHSLVGDARLPDKCELTLDESGCCVE